MSHLVSTKDLPTADLVGKSDPFVVLILKKTETKNRTRVSCTFANFLSGHVLCIMCTVLCLGDSSH